MYSWNAPSRWTPIVWFCWQQFTRPRRAGVALPAVEVRVADHEQAGAQVRRRPVDVHHLGGELVTRNPGIGREGLRTSERLQVRTADARVPHAQERLARARNGHRPLDDGDLAGPDDVNSFHLRSTQHSTGRRFTATPSRRGRPPPCATRQVARNHQMSAGQSQQALSEGQMHARPGSRWSCARRCVRHLIPRQAARRRRVRRRREATRVGGPEPPGRPTAARPRVVLHRSASLDHGRRSSHLTRSSRERGRRTRGPRRDHQRRSSHRRSSGRLPTLGRASGTPSAAPMR